MLFGRQAALVAVALLGLVVRPALARPVLAFVLLALVGLVNLLSYTLNRRGRYSSTLEGLQILLDVSAITTLAMLSGGLRSPLVVLFVAEVLAAAFSLSVLGCWIAAAASILGLAAIVGADARPIEWDLATVHGASILGASWLTLRLISRLRGRMQFRAAAAAHEIKNAVHATTGLIHEALLTLPASGASRLPLERAVQSLCGLSDLAQDLYRGSCLSSQWLSLETMVDDAALLAGPALRGAAIRVDIEPPARPARLRGDPQALRHCLLNVLLNAAEHSARGSIVRVHFSQNLLETRVTIESRMMEQAAGAPVPASTNGWGVGLRVVRALLASQGGVLESHADGSGLMHVHLVWRRFPMPSASHDLPGAHDTAGRRHRDEVRSAAPEAVRT